MLRGISVEAEPGRLVHVSGPNGSGKTTLLRVLAGLLPPEQGSVTWRGAPIDGDRDAYCAIIAYLAHSDGLKPELTASENLAFDVGLRRRVSAHEVATVLHRVGLGESQGRFAGVLSAGQRRRLGLARVLLADAPLWLLDEPFTNLDDTGAALVSELATLHLDAGGAILMAAHQSRAIPSGRARTLALS